MSEPARIPPELPRLAETAFEAPPVDAFSLPNGLEVWVAPRKSVPLAAVRLVVRGGRACDPPGRPGLAGLLAAALKEGTAKRSSSDVADLLQFAGAELVSAAGDELLLCGATGLASHLDVLLDVVADVVGSPAFPERDVERVKANAREDLATEESDPFFLADRAFRAALFGGHPYATLAPTPATIDAVTPGLLRAEAARRLSPRRALLVVAGDVRLQDVRPLVLRHFGVWSGGGAAGIPVAPAPSPLSAGRPVIVPRPGSVQATLAVGAPAPPRTSPDAAPLQIAVTIYGASFSSRLVSNLREAKGYTYSPGAAWRSLPAGGRTQTVAAVRTDVAGAALNEILYELRRMATTDVTEEELERAKGYDAGRLLLAVQTNVGLAGELADQWLHGLPPSALADRVEALRAVDAAAVRRAARRHLGCAAPAVVAVGEEAALREELAPFTPGD
jgi:zinc protease